VAEKKIKKVRIDGREVLCERDETILDAAKKAGIEIPTLCNDERLEPYGGCRLCIVEVKGVGRPLPACSTPVTNNMEVCTNNETITRIRKNLISLILSNHPNDCMRCEKTGDCDLQALAYKYEVDGSRFEGNSGTCRSGKTTRLLRMNRTSVFYVAGASGSAMKLLWQGP